MAQAEWMRAEPCFLTISGADKGKAGDDPEEGHCDYCK